MDSSAGTRFFGASEAGGVRAVNQDSFFVGVVRGKGPLALVADGMGGHRTGEVASQKAVQVISREFGRARVHPPAAIAKAVEAANLEIYDYAMQNPENRGMGTTLTLVYLDDQVGLVGHVGDSRAYLIREDGIKQLTQDHSWVAERVRQGLLSEDEARRHRWRNVITNALGASPEIDLDLLSFEVRPGDRVLLCSDGVSMLLADELLARAVGSAEPKEAVEALLKEANERGSPDNITAVVLLVESVEEHKKNYLPSGDHAPASIRLGSGVSVMSSVEEAFPLKGALSKLRRHPWYPQRYWLGCCFLLLGLIFFFILR